MIPYTSLTDFIGIKINLSYDEVMAVDNSALRHLLFTHKVLVFKGWHNLSPKKIIDLGEKLGKPWAYKDYKSIKEDARFDNQGRSYTDYTNKSYARLFSGIPWHVDIANEPGFARYPSRMLYCIDLPSKFKGMTTDVSNMARAYSDLSQEEKEKYSRRYFTYQSWQRVGTNIKDLPAIEEHPYTKEKFLRLNAVSQNNGWIRAWYEQQGTEKKYLDNELLKNIVKDLGNKYQYSHNWEIGDLIIFDNWATMHRKGEGEIFSDSVGDRRFVRVSIDTQLDPDFNYGNTNTK